MAKDRQDRKTTNNPSGPNERKKKTQKRWSERHPPAESGIKPCINTKEKRENPGYSNTDENQGTSYKSLTKQPEKKTKGNLRSERVIDRR